MTTCASKVVVILSALTVAVFAACAPSLVIPADGSSLDYESCGVTSQGVAVYRYETRCPDLRRVEERARRVRAADTLCSLDGVRVRVVAAYVMCDGEPVRGCTVHGDTITVTADAFVIPTIEHELRHVCYGQTGDALDDFRLDHPDATTDGTLNVTGGIMPFTPL